MILTLQHDLHSEKEDYPAATVADFCTAVLSPAQQNYVQEKDIVAFKENFVTLRELAILQGQSWQSLRATLREYDVAPFSPDGLDYGLLYEWVVLEKNDIAHRPRSL